MDLERDPVAKFLFLLNFAIDSSRQRSYGPGHEFDPKRLALPNRAYGLIGLPSDRTQLHCAPEAGNYLQSFGKKIVFGMKGLDEQRRKVCLTREIPEGERFSRRG